MREIPEFLERLRLPIENELTSAISEIEFEVDAKNVELERLRKELHEIGGLKNLLAETRGAEFHAIAAAALTRADSRFSLSGVGTNVSWLTEESNRIALVRTDAIASDMSLAVIGEAYQARAALNMSAEDTPLLLVANVYCQDQDAELKRRRSPVADSVAREAAKNRILVLRSFDLWQLVAEMHSVRREAVRDLLRTSLDKGGWLKVEGGAELIL